MVSNDDAAGTSPVRRCAGGYVILLSKSNGFESLQNAGEKESNQ
jgi:hypothetical protein